MMFSYAILIFQCAIFCNAVLKEKEVDEVFIAVPKLKKETETSGLGANYFQKFGENFFQMDFDTRQLGGEKVNLHLKSTTLPFTNDFSVGNIDEDDNFSYTITPSLPQEAYVDVDKGASIVVSKNLKNLRNIMAFFESKERSYGVVPVDEYVMGNKVHHRHKLFKVPEITFTDVERNILRTPEPVKDKISKNQTEQQAIVDSECLQVESVIVFDTVLGKHFKTYKEAVEYMATYLNAVNIRYLTISDVSNLTVRILLKSLIINKYEHAEPYIEASRLPGSNKFLDPNILLEEFTKFMIEHAKYLDYDLGVLITASKMPLSKPGTFTLGMAYNYGICDENYQYGIMREEPKSFISIPTFAHEIGHNLGLTHDGDGPQQNYPESPSAKNCAKKGFVMESVSSSSIEFSKCSGKQLEYFAALADSNCLKIRQTKKAFSSGFLPGEKLSRVEMCKKKFPDGTNVTDNSPTPCYVICKVDMLIYPPFPALDGHPCGDGKICWQAKCIRKGAPIPQICN